LNCEKVWYDVVMVIRDFRALSSSAQGEARKRAVQAVNSGQTQKAVAEANNVSKQALRKWMSLYGLHGEAGLNANPRGRKKGGGRLAPEKGGQIAKIVEENTPEKAGVSGYWLWTRDAAGDLIKSRYGANYCSGRYID
jgi:transposase